MSVEQRVQMTKQEIACCFAHYVLHLDRFSQVRVNENGDDCLDLEVYIFNREELDALLASVAQPS